MVILKLFFHLQNLMNKWLNHLKVIGQKLLITTIKQFKKEQKVLYKNYQELVIYHMYHIWEEHIHQLMKIWNLPHPIKFTQHIMDISARLILPMVEMLV